MSSSTPAIPRKTRRSFGAGDINDNTKPVGGNFLGIDHLAAFEDFRRRHVKQNRDIIGDNAARKISIRALEDQVTALQNEVMQVKAVNTRLRNQLARIRQEQTHTQNTVVRDALDHILEAIPALQLFRDSLDNVALSSQSYVSLEPAPKQKLVVPSGPKGALIRKTPDLGGIPEGSEVGGEGDLIEATAVNVTKRFNQRKPPTPNKTAGAASPPPKGLHLPLPIPELESNPSSPSSSSPSPRRNPSPRKKPAAAARKRRESGMLQVARRSPTPEEDIPAPANVPEIPTILDQQAIETLPEPESVEAAIIAESESRAGSHPPQDDDGGRGRRSRKSVNYKEPSLTKKMRKPDGLSLDEVLPKSRQSLSVPPVSSSSASSERSISPGPSLNPSSSSSSSSSTTSKSNPSNRIDPTSGIRRKSILPKSSHKSVIEILSDEEDLPAVDEMLHLESNFVVSRPTVPATIKSKYEWHETSPPTSSTIPRPQATSRIDNPPSPTKATRTSPRKATAPSLPLKNQQPPPSSSGGGSGNLFNRPAVGSSSSKATASIPSSSSGSGMSSTSSSSSINSKNGNTKSRDALKPISGGNGPSVHPDVRREAGYGSGEGKVGSIGGGNVVKEIGKTLAAQGNVNRDEGGGKKVGRRVSSAV